MRQSPGRRTFLRSTALALASPLLTLGPKTLAQSAPPKASGQDAERLRSLTDWTMLTMNTPNPTPYAAHIFHSKSGESLMRATNAVGPEHDPSAHGEVRTIRLACQKLQSASLRGYTLYTTCEPCAMCMACCLWANLDRVVFGATVADAAQYGHQILIPSAEVQHRSDMPCQVEGPIERDYCLRLFTNPTMQALFQKWKASGL